jgi:hypothetical protein
MLYLNNRRLHYLATSYAIDYMEYATDSTAQGAYVTSATAYTSQYPTAQSSTYVKATTEYDANLMAYFATDPTISLTGTNVDRVWTGGAGVTTNQRFHIDLGSSKIINRIRYDNYHVSGAETARGVNNFILQGSDTASGTFDDLVYANDGGWTQITGLSQSTFDEHTAADTADTKYITITGNTTAYRYYAFKFADNHGGPVIGLRDVRLQTTALNSFSESTIKTQGDYALKLEATTDALNETVTKTLTGGDILDLTGKNTIKLDARSTGTGSNMELSIRDSGNENSGNLFIEAETDITDKNGTHTITAVADAALSTAQYSGYNNSTKSVLLNGSTQYLTVPAHSDFDFGTGDYTIDLWYWGDTNDGSEYERLIDIEKSDSTDGYLILNIFPITGYTRISTVDGSVISGTTSIVDSTWHHIALVRNGTTNTLYVDGVSEGTPITDQTAVTAGGVWVGKSALGTAYLNGYVDNIRIVKGTALWTSGFNLTDAELLYAKYQTHTINISSADTYQTDSWDISGVADADKDAIDQLQLKVLNEDSARDYYLDNIYAE